jgi:hypothetical protein
MSRVYFLSMMGNYPAGTLRPLGCTQSLSFCGYMGAARAYLNLYLNTSGGVFLCCSCCSVPAASTVGWVTLHPYSLSIFSLLSTSLPKFCFETSCSRMLRQGCGALGHRVSVQCVCSIAVVEAMCTFPCPLDPTSS